MKEVSQAKELIVININSCSSDGLTQNIYSFMWGQFFNDNEPESIHIYQTEVLDVDFYKYLLKNNSPANIV
jgi:hypothetical protein